jgi:hypothetical protein
VSTSQKSTTVFPAGVTERRVSRPGKRRERKIPWTFTQLYLHPPEAL